MNRRGTCLHLAPNLSCIIIKINIKDKNKSETENRNRKQKTENRKQKTGDKRQATKRDSQASPIWQPKQSQAMQALPAAAPKSKRVNSRFEPAQTTSVTITVVLRVGGAQLHLCSPARAGGILVHRTAKPAPLGCTRRIPNLDCYLSHDLAS